MSDKKLDIDELARKAQGGDSAAESQLFKRLTARFRVILHHQIQNYDEIEDIMQDALSAIARDYKSLEIETTFAGWAVGVLRNRQLMFYRSRKSRRKRFSEADSSEEWHASETVSIELRTSLRDCIRRICCVNNRYARILVLSFQGFKIDEICNRLSITKSNAYSILSRSRSLLQLCLDTGQIS